MGPRHLHHSFPYSRCQLFSEEKILPKNSPLTCLLTADAVTLKNLNQTNSRMGQTIHHKSFHTNMCPIYALVRRVHHSMSNGGTPDTIISSYAAGDKLTSVDLNT